MRDANYLARQQILVNRLRKVPKLIAALDLLPGADWDTTPVAARRMTPEMWEAIALRAGVTPPSPTTQRLVIEALDSRRKVRDRWNATAWVRGLGLQVVKL